MIPVLLTEKEIEVLTIACNEKAKWVPKAEGLLWENLADRLRNSIEPAKEIVQHKTGPRCESPVSTQVHEFTVTLEPSEPEQEPETEEPNQWVEEQAKNPEVKGCTVEEGATAEPQPDDSLSKTLMGGSMGRDNVALGSPPKPEPTDEPQDAFAAEVTPETFPKWLRALRLGRNMTQASMAAIFLEEGLIDINTTDPVRRKRSAANRICMMEMGDVRLKQDFVDKSVAMLQRRIRRNESNTRPGPNSKSNAVIVPSTAPLEPLTEPYTFTQEEALAALVAYCHRPGNYHYAAEQCGAPARAIQLLHREVPEAERFVKTERLQELSEQVKGGITVQEAAE